MNGANGVWITTNEVRAEIEAWPASGTKLHFVTVTEGGAHDAADALINAYPAGTALLTDREDLANALRQRGAALVRHLHAMRHDLATIRDDGRPQRLTLRPWQAGDTDALAAALVSAYGPEHPDARSGELASAAADLVHTAEDPDNPLIATATRVAVHDNEPVGAAIVVRSDHVRGFTGPWLMNVFRSSKPAARGAGSAMVVAALRSLRDANEERLGLAVTHTNVTARALYERLGFEYTMEGWVVITPTPT